MCGHAYARKLEHKGQIAGIIGRTYTRKSGHKDQAEDRTAALMLVRMVASTQQKSLRSKA